MIYELKGSYTWFDDKGLDISIVTIKSHIMDPDTAWKHFKGKKVPSTLELDDKFFKIIPKGSKILDFACGWGRLAFRLQKYGYNIVGFDINPDLIEIARKLSKKTNQIYRTSASFDIADARSLPYPNASFDVCLIQAFMTALIKPKDREKVMDEAQRVLKEGGILYLADFEQNWEDPLYRERYIRDFPKTGEKGTFIVTEDGTQGSPEIFRAHHYTERELTELVEPRFEVEMFKRTTLKTYHGNRTKGFVIMARKGKI